MLGKRKAHNLSVRAVSYPSNETRIKKKSSDAGHKKSKNNPSVGAAPYPSHAKRKQKSSDAGHTKSTQPIGKTRIIPFKRKAQTKIPQMLDTQKAHNSSVRRAVHRHTRWANKKAAPSLALVCSLLLGPDKQPRVSLVGHE